MAKFKEGYIVKVGEEIGRIFRVNENTCVVQFSDRRKVVRMEVIEILDATENADIRTYKMYETKKCKMCGVTKPETEYSKMKGGKTRPQCKECFAKLIAEGHAKSKQQTKPKSVAKETNESKLVKEWVDVNLKTKDEVKQTTETLASHLEYFEKLSALAIKVVESIKELDLALNQSEVEHE